MLKLTKTGIGLLTKQYRSVLRKCLLLNLITISIFNSITDVNAQYAAGGGSATGSTATSIGHGSNASALAATAYGYASKASADSTVAVGDNSEASKLRATAVGNEAKARGYYSVSIGNYSNADGESSVALGSYAHAYPDRSVAIGSESSAKGTNSTAVGDRAKALGTSTVALGILTYAEGSQSMALGDSSAVRGDRSVSLGYRSSTSENDVISVGHLSTDLDYSGKAYGGSDYFRRIVNVAEGSGAHDAVTVSQLGNIASGTKILNANGENAITFGTGSGQTTVGTAISNVANQLYNYYYTFRVDERVEAIEFAKELRSNKKEMSSLDFMPIKSSSDLRISLIKAEDPLTFSVKTRDDSLGLMEVRHA